MIDISQEVFSCRVFPGGAEIVLLEGIVLTDVPVGKYFLSAAPLNLGGSDGAPCRAYLMRE